MLKHVALAASALALLAAGAASAQAAWQPEAIPGTTGALALNSFGFDRQGTASLVFEAFDQPQRFTGTATRAAGDGTWTRGANIPGIGWAGAEVQLYASTRALLVTRQVRSFGRFNRANFRLVYALGRTSGGFGTYRQIASSANVPASAVNPAGDALVAYTPQNGTAVRVSERRAGGRFGTPRILSSGGALSPAVAVDARGDRVVAWFRGNRVEARVKLAGHNWGSVLTAARLTRTPNASLRALMTSDGRAVLAWQTLDIREGHPSQVAAGVALRPRNAGWRGALLEQSTLGAQAQPGDADAIPLVDTRGDVHVVWTGRWQEGTGVRIAQVTNAARIHGPDLLSAEDQSATLDDAAAGPQNQIAVTYFAANGTWVNTGAGAPVPLTPAGETAIAGSRVAFSPQTAQPLVVRPFVSGSQGALVASAPIP
ncbi:MAG TPA: hypothetical protein VNS09_27365 [Solirubrobacter sp.]|nr:hypothetical protein [Solirubrobacter sp.]